MNEISASIDTSAGAFEKDVIEASRTRPVIVDFWAPWCGPCRVLKPILEKLAREYGGKFVLAKLNTDEHPEIAGRYGVRGIPNVKAFVNGSVADEFVGALPESGVRAFIERLLPSPAETLRRAAQAAVTEGDFEAAESRLREAIAIDERNVAARIDLAELLAARHDYAGANAVLDAVPEHERDDRAARVTAQIALWTSAKDLPSVEILRERLAAHPEDLAARLQFAERLTAESRYEPALEALLEVVRRDRAALRESARQAMLRIFSLAGDAELVGRYRRLLASALN